MNLSAEPRTLPFVVKQTFETPAFRLHSGATIPLRMGYETYGTLNAAGDNGILICRYFGGNSHAAGRYSEKEAVSGYWDDLIGPGKPVDTDRYFVVASDCLLNYTLNAPGIVTTGPASINPETGNPYGSSFPELSFRDLVEANRALMEHLGITYWQAVMGASSGGMQALQWMVMYPEKVARVIPVGAPAVATPFYRGLVQAMIEAVEEDENWHGGDYYGLTPPASGLRRSWGYLYTQAFSTVLYSSEMFWMSGGETRPMQKKLKILSQFECPKMDAHTLVRYSKLCQTFDLTDGYPSLEAAMARFKGKVLSVAVAEDATFPLDVVKQDLIAPLQAAGVDVTLHVMSSPNGHYGSVQDFPKEGEALRAFLA